VSFTKHNVEALLGISADQLPKHIAIIMDGNGRWAKRRGQPRFQGHRSGAKNVNRIVLECSKLGIECLTLYSFSTENWKRPKAEVDMIMHLFAEYLVGVRPDLMKYNVRMVHVGRKEGLPQVVADKMRETEELTKGNTGLTLALALNYSSRVEMTDAVQAVARDVAAGALRVEDISEKTIESHLYTAGLPDPDLLIRTSDERRISNFLLWQLSYAEFYIAKVFWPDFRERHLRRAILSYAGRDRRFGGLKDAPDVPEPTSGSTNA